MKWVDDVKKKAKDAADGVVERVREETGKAAVKSTLGAVHKRVGELTEGVLSTAEKHLEERQREVDARHATWFGPTDEARSPEGGETAEPSQAARAPDSSQDPMAHPSEDATTDAVDAMDPPAGITPERAEPSRVDAATEALRRAAAARGVAYEEPPAPPESDKNPLSSAEAVLQRAAEARELARTGRRGAEREDRARAELARLKAQLGGLPAGATGGDDDPDDTPGPDAEGAPRRRRL